MAIQVSGLADDVVALAHALPISGSRRSMLTWYEPSSRCSSTAACPPPGRISCKPWSQIEPADVRWINLTHPDRNHVGSLLGVLGAAPNAHLITTFLRPGNDQSPIAMEET